MSRNKSVRPTSTRSLKSLKPFRTPRTSRSTPSSSTIQSTIITCNFPEDCKADTAASGKDFYRCTYRCHEGEIIVPVSWLVGESLAGIRSAWCKKYSASK